MRQEIWSAPFLMTVMFAAMVGGSAEFTCPRWSFHNVSITTCKLSEVDSITDKKFVHPSSVRILEYDISVVERHGTPELCVLRRNSSYYQQIIASVVNYRNTTFFGVSVWNHKTLSAHSFIVNEKNELILQENLTSTSSNLQNLFDTAFQCKRSSDSHDTHRVDTTIYAVAATAALVAIVCVLIQGFIICFLRCRVKSSR